MKKLLLPLALLIGMLCNATDNSIIGNTTPMNGSIETYTVNWDSWGSIYEQYANVIWTVTKGTVISSDKHSVTIQWDNLPTWINDYGTVEVTEDLSGTSASTQVIITNFIEGISISCQGVLGPTVIFETFGAGYNPGPPLPTGVTTYIYEADCRNVVPQHYTIINYTAGCRIFQGDDQWLALSDHTVDNNGYMLLVNGDDQAGEVYKARASNLTNVFEYEFSAWVANLSDPAAGYQEPRVEFEIFDINGVRLGGSGIITISYTPQSPWMRISFLFQLPLSISEVDIKLTNHNNDPFGNDFVVDDISFAPCVPPIIASFSPNPTVMSKSYTCNSGIVNVYSWWPVSSTLTNPSFRWQRSTDGVSWADISGATTMSYTISETIASRYYYRIIAYQTSNPNLIIISNTLIFFVQKMVVQPQTFYVSGCTSETVQLNPITYLDYSDPSQNLTYTYIWTPGSYLDNASIKNPNISLPVLPPLYPPNPPNPPPPTNYYYSLTVQNVEYGCSSSGIQTVSHINPRKVYLFNAFTPNNDGSNDYFRPINIQDYNSFGGAEFSIYNRWGQRIFYRTSGVTLADWSWYGTYNGVTQPADVYIYTLRIPGCPNNYQACPACITPPAYVNEPDSSNNWTISGSFVLIRD